MGPRFVRVISAAIAAIGIAGGTPSAASAALPYDGTNPAATVCGDGSHTVYTLASAYIYSGSTRIGLVELRHSAYCATVWSRVTNLTSKTISVREKVYTYPSPNGGTATVYTETDTLSPAGGATDSGWSHQYRDRPGFLARGEISWNGTWLAASTVRGVMFVQFDGNYPSTPWTCDDTATNICHRYATNSDGSPKIVQYGFDQTTLALLTSSPTSAITTVLNSYSALSGGSPTMNATTPDNADVLYWAYDGSNEPLVYARSQSWFWSTYPQYYYGGYTKFNYHGPSVTDWKPLVCHEFGHVLGLLDMVYSGHAASKSTCVGATYSSPQIDDQQALSLIYSTPLKSN